MWGSLKLLSSGLKEKQNKKTKQLNSCNPTRQFHSDFINV